MVHTIRKDGPETAQRDALRRELLKLILKNEAQRRVEHKASDK